MYPFLLLRLEGPLQSWGTVAIDPMRPTGPFPTRSALAGMLASALGWRYRDAERTTALQDRIWYAVREDRAPRVLTDLQTVDLGRDGVGWTRWGVEGRGGAFSDGTHMLRKEYLADASFLVAMGLREGEGPSLAEIEDVLVRPARPLFLGRKACPPAGRILEGRADALTPLAALSGAPLAAGADDPPVRCWADLRDLPGTEPLTHFDVWDRRDFFSDRFGGSRRVAEVRIEPRGPEGSP